MVSSIIPLYHGPYVKIRVNPSGDEYTVSKPLLCRESAYFSAMFEGEFLEGHQQTAILDEMEGVISARSLDGRPSSKQMTPAKLLLRHSASLRMISISLTRSSDPTAPLFGLAIAKYVLWQELCEDNTDLSVCASSGKHPIVCWLQRQLNRLYYPGFNNQPQHDGDSKPFYYVGVHLSTSSFA